MFEFYALYELRRRISEGIALVGDKRRKIVAQDLLNTFTRNASLRMERGQTFSGQEGGITPRSSNQECTDYGESMQIEERGINPPS